jgi:hypothetical protein
MPCECRHRCIRGAPSACERITADRLGSPPDGAINGWGEEGSKVPERQSSRQLAGGKAMYESVNEESKSKKVTKVLPESFPLRG